MFRAVIFMMMVFAGMASGKGPNAATFSRVFPIDSLNYVVAAPDRAEAAQRLAASGFAALDSVTFDRQRGTPAVEVVTLEVSAEQRVTAARHELRCGLACADLVTAWWIRYRSGLGAVGVQYERSLVFTPPNRAWQVRVTLEGEDGRARLVTRSSR